MMDEAAMNQAVQLMLPMLIIYGIVCCLVLIPMIYRFRMASFVLLDDPTGRAFAALKTSGRWVDEMILKAPVAMKLALGENPKSVYNERHETPVTRMATAAIIREHHGQIMLESELGKGVTVHITLPLERGETDESFDEAKET